jgi:hypothetical protein
MKDARGHGSAGFGGQFKADLERFAAAHQSGVSGIPSLEGSRLWADLSAAAYSAHPYEHSGMSPADLRGMG